MTRGKLPSSSAGLQFMRDMAEDNRTWRGHIPDEEPAANNSGLMILLQGLQMTLISHREFSLGVRKVFEIRGAVPRILGRRHKTSQLRRGPDTCGANRVLANDIPFFLSSLS